MEASVHNFNRIEKSIKRSEADILQLKDLSNLKQDYLKKENYSEAT